MSLIKRLRSIQNRLSQEEKENREKLKSEVEEKLKKSVSDFVKKLPESLVYCAERGKNEAVFTIYTLGESTHLFFELKRHGIELSLHNFGHCFDEVRAFCHRENLRLTLDIALVDEKDKPLQSLFSHYLSYEVSVRIQW